MITINFPDEKVRAIYAGGILFYIFFFSQEKQSTIVRSINAQLM